MEKKVNGRQDYHWKSINYSFVDRFDHGRYGLKPDHRILAAHVTINDELPNRIASGTVQVDSIAYVKLIDSNYRSNRISPVSQSMEWFSTMIQLSNMSI